MRKKIILTSLVAIMVVAITAVALVSCSAADSKYFEKISQFTFWSNKGSEAIPQTALPAIVEDHMKSDSNGKVKKVALIGFDGCRADNLVNVIPSGVKDKDGNDIYTGHNGIAKYSAINTLAETGGIYMAFAGGEKGKETQQATSTGPGWAALLSGAWGNLNGVVDNGKQYPKNLDYKTLLLKYAENEGLRTSFNASWAPHFTENYVKEIAYLKEHSEIPMVFNQVANDFELHDAMLNAVTEGSETECDITFGIYEFCDHAGHGTGFTNENNQYVNAVKTSDNYAYEVIQTIKARENYDNEDWLIMIFNDHGGLIQSHGGQSLEERSTFMISNKKIDSKHFSKNYNGYTLG